MIADVYESCSSLIPKMITEYNQQWLCTRPHQDGTFAAQRGASYRCVSNCVYHWLHTYL